MGEYFPAVSGVCVWLSTVEACGSLGRRRRDSKIIASFNCECLTDSYKATRIQHGAIQIRVVCAYVLLCQSRSKESSLSSPKRRIQNGCKNDRERKVGRKRQEREEGERLISYLLFEGDGRNQNAGRVIYEKNIGRPALGKISSRVVSCRMGSFPFSNGLEPML